MNFKNTCFVLAVLAGTAAFAQETLGSVADVQGLATITTGSGGAAAAPGAPIAHGSRIMTTANGRVTLRLQGGCTVAVPPGHALTVLSTMSCEQLAAAVTPVATQAAATQVMGQAAGGNATLVNGVIVGTGALIAAAIIREEVDDDDDAPVSAR